MTKRVSPAPLRGGGVIAFAVDSPHSAARRTKALAVSVALHAGVLAALFAGRVATMAIEEREIEFYFPDPIERPAVEARPRIRPPAKAEKDLVPEVIERPVPVPPATAPALPAVSDPSDLFDPEPGSIQTPIVGGGATESLPRAVRWELPAYPETLRRLAQEGDVRAVFLVHKDGSVDEVRVEGRSEFARPVEDAIRRTQFVPAMQNGRPIAFWMKIVFRFRLDGRPVAISPEPATPE